MHEPKLTTGRIDVHAHLIPGVDDGCASVEESIACARLLAGAGYTHAFCTPHIWPHLPYNNAEQIRRRTAELQAQVEAAGVRLKLLPGGELGLRPELMSAGAGEIVTYGLAGRFCLFDLWADRLPAFFRPAVRHLQSLGMTVVMAHPERMRAVQDETGLVDQLQEMGILLQGNLQCLSDPEEWATRQLAERFLLEGRYFMLGTDTHRPGSLACRLAGLERAIELAGTGRVAKLTVHNPRQLV